MRAHHLYAAAVALLGASQQALATDSSLPSRHAPTPQFHNAALHPGADPYVLYDSASGEYYAYSTEGADPGSLFAIYSSPDLSTWKKHPGGALKACYDDGGNKLEAGQACWARDWQWAPETYYNEKTGWYFFFFAGRLREDMAASYFRYSAFEEPSKIGVAVSRSPAGPFHEIQSKPIDWYPFDPEYHDVNLIMDDKQMLPPQSLEKGQTAPKGTFIPTIDPNVFFAEDGRIYLYASRNAYRNWNWDGQLGKYIEESNIIVVELARQWWDDPKASTMPEIIPSQVNKHKKDAPKLPSNMTSYNGTGEVSTPARMDGWKTVISYGADPQDWENYHVDDYAKYNGTKKDRRWSEGSTVITRPDTHHRHGGNKPIYLLTYSANNYEAAYYGVGFATAESPLGPFNKSSSNPILAEAPNGTVPIYSTGHGSIVASPPRKGLLGFFSEDVGAQEVTHRTPHGSELFYVHHARNSTDSSRSLYATRMTLDESAVTFGSDGALAMHLTPLDQPLPKNTYPLRMETRCQGRNGAQVRVVSQAGAAFDLTEGTNRIVGVPRQEGPVAVTEAGRWYEAKFGSHVRRVAYQRLLLDGKWETITEQALWCL